MQKYQLQGTMKTFQLPRTMQKTQLTGNNAIILVTYWKQYKHTSNRNNTNIQVTGTIQTYN